MSDASGPAIDRHGPVPVYVQVADYLRKQIVSGVYRENERIPSTPELQGIYGVSHVTARKAVAILVNEGLLFHSQGKGVFVAQK